MKNRVFYNHELAGYLSKQGNNYLFEYLPDYVDSAKPPIGYHFPLRKQPYISEEYLHPYFENLVAEGWLLESQSRDQRIDENDFYTLLVNNGVDLIGAVTILKGETGDV